MQILISVVIAVILLCVSIIIADSNRFRVVHYELQSEKIKEDFHFVFLSDLHNKTYGKQNERLLRAIDRQNAQMILVGGDILTAKPGEPLDAAVSFIQTLSQKYPLVYANGNHEQRLKLYPEKYEGMDEAYEQALQQAGVHRLVNARHSEPDFNLELVGCEIGKIYYKRFRRTEMEAGYLESILGKADTSSYTILLAHNPDYFEQYGAWGADLVLSGHVHGGVVRIPGIGGVISTNFTLFPKYDGGYFKQNRTEMIISRGLGAHTIPFRLFNPAELVDITIRAKT